MKVLVIGGAGYIGSHVTKHLIHEGHETVVFDDLSSGLEENIFTRSRFVLGNILDRRALVDTAAEGFDALVHLAAFKAAGESMERPSKYGVNNIGGTMNILAAAETAGIRFVVFSSSAAVYGEPEYLPLDENHPTNPENFYGFTKLEIERTLGWFDRLKNIRFAALRYFNAAGYDVEGEITGLERSPANLLPVIMEAACGMRAGLKIFGDDYPTPDGTGVRDYIHVDDLADAHLKALDYISENGRSLTVNLGSERGLSVLEILEAARRITGREISADTVGRRPGDPAKLVASAALAKELLGWQARYSDVDTLVETSWKAYRTHCP